MLLCKRLFYDGNYVCKASHCASEVFTQPSLTITPEHLLQVKEKKDLLARLETLDNGKPISEAAWDIVSISSLDHVSQQLYPSPLIIHLGPEAQQR